MRRKAKAKLYLRFRTLDGKQSPYCPALLDNKSRIRPFWCLVKGVEELHRDGTYYRRAKRDGKWQWESPGNDANAAYAKLNVPRLLLVMPTAKNEAAAPTVKDGFRLDDEVAAYLGNISKLSPKTFKAYGRSLELFRQSCKKIYVHQITKQDLQGFDTALLERGDEDRTPCWKQTINSA